MTVAQPILPHDLRLPDIQVTARELYIDGQWLPSQSGQMIEVVRPSTEAVLKQSGLGREAASITALPNSWKPNISQRAFDAGRTIWKRIPSASVATSLISMRSSMTLWRAAQSRATRFLCFRYCLRRRSDRKARFVFFRKGGRPASPVHMFIHGGYWRMFSKRDYSYVANYNNEGRGNRASSSITH